jgi:hypothetical protein
MKRKKLKKRYKNNLSAGQNTKTRRTLFVQNMCLLGDRRGESMRRSKSEGYIGSLGLAGGLMHGAIADMKPKDPKTCTIESPSMRSYAVIKALPNASKFMHVELSAVRRWRFFHQATAQTPSTHTTSAAPGLPETESEDEDFVDGSLVFKCQLPPPLYPKFPSQFADKDKNKNNLLLMETSENVVYTYISFFLLTYLGLSSQKSY